jgi:uncharacterized protein (DUF1800 family)
VRTEFEQKIAHLHRRAGFGLSPAELAIAKRKGLDECTDELLHPEKVHDEVDARLAEMQGEIFDLSNFEDAQSWWIYRMIHTRRPLVEKMTLFWHGHFATANSKVDNPRMMVHQNRLFREHALGKFKDLLLGVARDPAMIVWLDNGLSSKKHANENFARELMELFTLGIGHYSEQEIREVARSFTGWKQKNGEFSFDAKDHDEDPKTFLGQSAAWTGEDVIEALARHLATGRLIAKKLVRFFVADEGCEPLERQVAEVFGRTDGDLRACVGTILKSPRFYDATSMRAKVKSPVEFVVGSIRELASTMPIRGLGGVMAKMGQSIFNPPTVKGWDGGLDWIDTATLFERAAFANQIVTERGKKEDNWFEPEDWVPKGSDAKATVAIFLDALVDGRIRDASRATCEEFMAGKGKSGETVAFQADPGSLDRKARGVVRLILSSPEYQLA